MWPACLRQAFLTAVCSASMNSSPGIRHSFTIHRLISLNGGTVHRAQEAPQPFRAHGLGVLSMPVMLCLQPPGVYSCPDRRPGLPTGMGTYLEVQGTLLRAGAFQKVVSTSHFIDEETKADCHFLSVNVRECSAHLETCTVTYCSAAFHQPIAHVCTQPPVEEEIR